jgi:hypothetical protein
LAAGVGVGGGQPGSNAIVRRSLAVEQPCGTSASPRGGARRYAGRRRVANGGATRSGGGGPQDLALTKKNRYGDVFAYTCPYPTL